MAAILSPSNFVKIFFLFVILSGSSIANEFVDDQKSLNSNVDYHSVRATAQNDNLFPDVHGQKASVLIRRELANASISKQDQEMRRQFINSRPLDQVSAKILPRSNINH